MFEECKNLQDLNKSRMEAVKAGEDSRIVNAAYNAKRKEIMTANKPYKVISVHRAPTTNIQPVIYLPYLGQSDSPATIEIVPTGIKC